MIGQLMELAVEVTANTDNVVMLWYSGHTNTFEFSVFLGGWYKNTTPDLNYRFYPSEEDKVQKVINFLELLLSRATEGKRLVSDFFDMEA
jgi:hypothetical protein